MRERSVRSPRILAQEACRRSGGVPVGDISGVNWTMVRTAAERLQCGDLNRVRRVTLGGPAGGVELVRNRRRTGRDGVRVRPVLRVGERPSLTTAIHCLCGVDVEEQGDLDEVTSHLAATTAAQGPPSGRRSRRGLSAGHGALGEDAGEERLTLVASHRSRAGPSGVRVARK